MSANVAKKTMTTYIRVQVTKVSAKNKTFFLDVANVYYLFANFVFRMK